MKKIALAALFGFPLLVGCATTNQGPSASLFSAAAAGGKRSGIAYSPSAPPSARLPSDKLPRVILANVSDETGGGDYRGPIVYNMPVRWSEVVKDALTTELGRVGWP